MNDNLRLVSYTALSTGRRRSMKSIALLALFAGQIWFAGCAASRDRWHKGVSAVGTYHVGVWNNVASGGRNMRHSLRRITSESSVPVQVPAHVWDWTAGIPLDAVRGDLVTTDLPADSLARFVPGAPNPDIQLASTAPPTQSYRVTHVDSVPVRDFGELYSQIERAVETGKAVQVDLETSPHGRCVAYRVEPKNLHALAQVASPTIGRIRVADNGNSSLFFRHDGIACKLTARIERQRGLLHVVASFCNCDGAETLLPVEVQARCDGSELQCLSVDQTLEALYLDPKSSRPSLEKAAVHSFAAASESPDYLLPTQYNRVAGHVGKIYDRTTMPAPLPAFATIPGEVYPGPAVLGDARALSGFFLQRQVYRPGDPERSGWIVFRGESLRTAKAVELLLDLGKGAETIRFEVPQS